MNRRLAVYELLAGFNLNPEQGRALEGLAGLRAEPASLQSILARTVIVLGTGLLGLGLIVWLAANWPDLGRSTKFGLLQLLIVTSVLAALWRPAARSALLLLAFLAQGGVLAFFGQTYQTGADTWQLFALWAVVGLPLALAARSDALWLPFSIVTMAAISLATTAHTGHRWSFHPEVSSIYYLNWLSVALVVVLLSPITAIHRISGAGVWAFRASVLQAMAQLGFTALTALFEDHVQPHYALGLLVATASAYGFARKPLRDVFALSLAALSIDVLLIAGLTRLLFDFRGDKMLTFLLLGLLSASIVAASAALVHKLTRKHTDEALAEVKS